MVEVHGHNLKPILDSIRSLAPVIEAERGRLDSEREMSTELIDVIVAAGLFRLWTPREFGGAELDPVSALRVIMAVSELDGSVGWNVMISSAYSFFAGRLPARAAEKIYSDPRAAVAGQLEPGGTAKVIDSGYRVSGRWPFGSGCKQATWFLAQCLVHENGGPRQGARGRPELRLVFVPADQCQIYDTWYVGGLRGTGSHDYSIEDVEVPSEYGFDLLADQPTRPEPLYSCPCIMLLTSAIAAIPVGIARTAIRAFKELAKTKRSVDVARSRSSQTLSEHPTVQGELARAEMLVRSAERLLFDAVKDMWETVQAGNNPTLEQRAEVRLGCINAGVSAVQAVDIVYHLGGSASIFERLPLERCFRDVHTASQHVAVAPRGLEVVGRVLLGMEPRGLI